MNRRVLTLVVAVSAWLAIGVGLAQAQIYPVSTTFPFPLNTGSTVTVTLSQSGVATPNWLPSPGATVSLTINSGGVPLAAQPPISLICPDGSPTTVSCAPATAAQANPIVAGPIVAGSITGALTTSAYPGVCTNFSDPTLATYSADFTISGNTLTPLDCGGMAVVRVTVSGVDYTFIIPQDSDFDGIPDIWEAKFGPASGAGSLVANLDNDHDGLSNFDEYRGVMLTTSSRSHIRLHPNERDLFVALVNPGCGATDGLLDNVGTPTYIPDLTNARTLFDNLNNVLPAIATDPPGPRVHPIGYPLGAPSTHGTTGDWLDSYSSCSFNSVTGDLDLSFLALPTADLDRIVSANAVYDVSEKPNTTLAPSAPSGTVTFTAGAKVFNQGHVGASITRTDGVSGVALITDFTSQTQVRANVPSGMFSSTSAIAAGAWQISGADQKGLRCVESLDASSTIIYALGGWTTPDDTVNCTIYSKRIEFRLKNANTTLGPLGLIPKGGSRLLRIQTTFDGGKTWVTQFQQTAIDATSRSEAERRVVAEVIRFYATMEWAHGGKLTPTLGTCANHDCAGTGYVLDKDFVQVIDRSTSGFNTFRIPTQSNSTLTSGFKLRTP